MVPTAQGKNKNRLQSMSPTQPQAHPLSFQGFSSKLCCSERRAHRTAMGKWGLPAPDRGNTAPTLF